MRADIHDGPEHMLQSEAGYIDARPLNASSTKPLATHGRTIHPGHSLRFDQTPITSAVPRLAVIFKVVACLKGAKIGQERVSSNFDPSILPEHKLSESLKANRHPKARTYLDGTQLGMRGPGRV